MQMNKSHQNINDTYVDTGRPYVIEPYFYDRQYFSSQDFNKPLFAAHMRFQNHPNIEW